MQAITEVVLPRIGLFWDGAKTTLELTALSATFGLLIGIILGVMKLHHSKLVQAPAAVVVAVMRGTPLLVQILFAYFALPSLIPAFKFNEFTAAALALAFNVGAYNAEAIRAGVLAVPKGQREASLALGFSEFQTMRWVVMPQALRIVLPPLVNNVVALLKDSALASSIGLLELSLVGSRISSETFQPVPSLVTVAVIYMILTTIISSFAFLLEKKVNKR